MKNVVIGLLGNTLDQGFGSKRREYRRPTVGVCMHEGLLVEEFHLVYQVNFKKSWHCWSGKIFSLCHRKPRYYYTMLISRIPGKIFTICRCDSSNE